MPRLLQTYRMYRTIIAGGRDYQLTPDDYRYLDTLPISEVVCGCARGADTGGAEWADSRSIDVKRFPANWTLHGKAAGFIRNQEMADYAEAVVLFPGGRGTADMRRRAKATGLVIWEGKRPR